MKINQINSNIFSINFSNISPQNFCERKSVDNKGLEFDRLQFSGRKKDTLNLDIAPKKIPIDSKYLSAETILFNDKSELGRKTKLNLIEFLEENKTLTLDSDKNLFERISKREYDIPKLMLIAEYNSLVQKGNSYIYGNKTPKIFENINKEKLCQKLGEVVDNASEYLEKEQIGTFNIDGNNFYIKRKGGGFVGEVYVIYDNNGNKVAIKDYISGLPVNNGDCEIATLRQMTKDKVNNVPEFYMANAASYTIDKNGKRYLASKWLLYEYIDKKTPVKKGGISWEDWCHKYGLEHEDAGKNQKIGRYLVDVGGINHRKNFEYKYFKKALNTLKYSLRENERTMEETIEKIKENI